MSLTLKAWLDKEQLLPAEFSARANVHKSTICRVLLKRKCSWKLATLIETATRGEVTAASVMEFVHGKPLVTNCEVTSADFMADDDTATPPPATASTGRAA